MDQMKSNFKLVKRSRGYAISSTSNEAVQFAAQILVGKIIRKFRIDEVLAPVVFLAT